MTQHTYTPITWVDEVPSATPLKYQIVEDTDGELAASATIELITALTTPGTAVNATNLNHIEQGLETVQEQANEQERLAARATVASAGNIVPNDTDTLIPFSAATFDTHSCLTVGASFKFTADRDGIFEVRAHVTFTSQTWPDGSSVDLTIRKNGAFYSHIGGYVAGGDTTGVVRLDGSDLIELEAGDYVQIYVYQDSGSGVGCPAHMSVSLV